MVGVRCPVKTECNLFQIFVCCGYSDRRHTHYRCRCQNNCYRRCHIFLIHLFHKFRFLFLFNNFLLLRIMSHIQPWHSEMTDHIDCQKQKQADHNNKNDHCKHFVESVCFLHSCHIHTKSVKSAQPFRHHCSYHCVRSRNLQS